jgi:hypothetical protein
MQRYIFFALILIFGVSIGLYYGMEVSPIELVNTSPDTLRIDYKTDYILMVAEAYAAEDDPIMAVRRLALLGAQDPVAKMSETLQFAAENGYTLDDLVLIRALAEDLINWNPSLDTGGSQ